MKIQSFAFFRRRSEQKTAFLAFFLFIDLFCCSPCELNKMIILYFRIFSDVSITILFQILLNMFKIVFLPFILVPLGDLNSNELM